MKNKVYIIEGIDRLGKSTLIQGIQNKLGFYQVIHYEKPKKLDYYDGDLRKYQEQNFATMFRLISSGAPLILDRAHLGECVYSPMYRNYQGDYVFDLEHAWSNYLGDACLVLLTEDFSKSTHFEDDGLSLGKPEQRSLEQSLFFEAFHKSIIPTKKVVCVTDPVGLFKPKEVILEEVLA